MKKPTVAVTSVLRVCRPLNEVLRPGFCMSPNNESFCVPPIDFTWHRTDRSIEAHLSILFSYRLNLFSFSFVFVIIMLSPHLYPSPPLIPTFHLLQTFSRSLSLLTSIPMPPASFIAVVEIKLNHLLPGSLLLVCCSFFFLWILLQLWLWL